MNRLDARDQRAKRTERIRQEEGLCALDFLTWGDTQGDHAKRCLRPAGLVCSREYDPGAMPEDEKLYEGTGIGSLYGLNGTEHDPHAWQLAGWNVKMDREETA